MFSAKITTPKITSLFVSQILRKQIDFELLKTVQIVSREIIFVLESPCLWMFVSVHEQRENYGNLLVMSCLKDVAIKKDC